MDGSGRCKRNRDGEIIFNFGKHAGQLACNHPNYLEWMINEGEFPTDTKKAANRIYKHWQWEKEIGAWMAKNSPTATKELASALYTTVRLAKALTHLPPKKGECLIITFQSQPPSSLTFQNAYAVRLLLRFLDDILRK